MIFVLDMDGTLIDSNEANFLSYKDAYESILKENFTLEYNHLRFTFKDLKKYFPHLTPKQKQQIKEEKTRLYAQYLSYTKINQNLLNHILRFIKTHKIFLCTNAAKQRVEMIVKYHHLDFLSGIYCNESDNKFLNFLKHYNFDAKDIIVFENDDSQISCALQAGVLKQNIIKIGMCHETT